MRRGSYRQHCKLLAPRQATPDSQGRTPLEFEQVDLVWCSIEPLQGQELWIAQQARANVTHTIKTAYNPLVNERCRLETIPGGKVFELGPPIDVEERQIELVIQATQRTS